MKYKKIPKVQETTLTKCVVFESDLNSTIKRLRNERIELKILQNIGGLTPESIKLMDELVETQSKIVEKLERIKTLQEKAIKICKLHRIADNL